MIRILVVDDEDLGRSRICRLLEKSSHSDTVARWEIREARNGIEALAVAIEWNPEIIFLDMEMPEMSGTDFLHHLPDRNVLVIFQTAHERFALKAFEHAAVDFLLKPFTAERFQESLDRAIKQLQGRSKLAGIESMLQERKRFLRTFVVRVGERNRVIAEDEVVSFTSEDHVTMLCTNTISYAYQHSLAYLEQHLDPAVFLRIHKGRIIRLDALVSFTTTRPMMAVMKNGEKFRVSREREKDLRAVFTVGSSGPQV